jgi:hypothetical protein
MAQFELSVNTAMVLMLALKLLLISVVCTNYYLLPSHSVCPLRSLVTRK